VGGWGGYREDLTKEARPGGGGGLERRWGKPQSRQSAKPFFKSSKLGLPQPLTAGECDCALPHRFWGEGHTQWRERGWESLNSDEGTYTVVLFIFMYFVGQTGSRSRDRREREEGRKRNPNSDSRGSIMPCDVKTSFKTDL
jgi:hypothetical protein